MAIEKTLTPIDPDAVEVPLNGMATEIEIEIEPSLEQDDGSMIIDFEDAPSGLEAGFGENLAEVMDEADLASLGSELIELFNADRESRADWENTYVTG